MPTESTILIHGVSGTGRPKTEGHAAANHREEDEQRPWSKGGGNYAPTSPIALAFGSHSGPAGYIS